MDVDDVSGLYARFLESQYKIFERAKTRRGEQPNDRKSKDELYQLYMLIFEGPGVAPRADQILSYFMPQPYPPSATPLESLRPTWIRDLQLETHHRGTYIMLRSVAPPCRRTAVLTIVVDEFDDAVSLQLHQHDSEDVRPAMHYINEETLIIAKEPFLKVLPDGNYGLRVDHISDVVFVDKTDARAPPAWRVDQPECSPQDLKVKGNQQMEAGNTWSAIKCYSLALSLPATEDMLDTIRRNRSLAYLKVRAYDAALSDTGYPMLSSKSSDKALFRAAESLYHLERYKECAQVAQVLCDANPSNEQAVIASQRAQNRIEEQKTGVYNFSRFQKLIHKLQLPHLDFATFIGPIDVNYTESKGRGLFLTADVKAGDLLLCEKAFCHAYVEEEKGLKPTMLAHPGIGRCYIGGQADLVKRIVQKLYRNPSLAPRFTNLYHGGYQPVDVTEVDTQPVVDTFLVDTILSYNCIGCPMSSLDNHKDLIRSRQPEKDAFHSCGIWTRASFINHSCVSNARRSFIGDMIIVRASRDQPAGSEITFWYQNPTWQDPTKLREKLSHWDFICDCALCQDYAATNATIFRERQQLSDSLEFLLRSDSTRDTIIKIERQLRALERTYQQPAAIVPQLELWEPQLAFAYIFAQKGNAIGSLKWIGNALSSLGFVVAGLDFTDTPLSIRKWGLPIDPLVMAFMNARAAFLALNDMQKAEKAEEYARTMFKIVVGDDSSFDTVYF